jgi:hypothetical protein
MNREEHESATKEIIKFQFSNLGRDAGLKVALCGREGMP